MRAIPLSPQNQYVDIPTLFKMLEEAGRPIQVKLDSIVDRLSNSATKTDLEKVRGEVFDKIDRVEKSMTSGYVPRDLYETRHAQLIERDTRLEDFVRQNTQETSVRFKEVQQQVDERLRENTNKDLSEKDRKWVRSTQLACWIGIGFTLLSFILSIIVLLIGHIRFN